MRLGRSCRCSPCRVPPGGVGASIRHAAAWGTPLLGGCPLFSEGGRQHGAGRRRRRASVTNGSWGRAGGRKARGVPALCGRRGSKTAGSGCGSWTHRAGSGHPGGGQRRRQPRQARPPDRSFTRDLFRRARPAAGRNSLIFLHRVSAAQLVASDKGQSVNFRGAVGSIDIFPPNYTNILPVKISGPAGAAGAGAYPAIASGSVAESGAEE